MQVEYRDGLLFTSITITFQGKTKTINNVIIDTGASHTLISQDAVDEIGIRVSYEDHIVTSYGIGGKEHAFVKKVDLLLLGHFEMKDIHLDFSSFQYTDANGLLGLDILMAAGAVINLKEKIIMIQSR
jgi:predicted aspartyl protease